MGISIRRPVTEPQDTACSQQACWRRHGASIRSRSEDQAICESAAA